MPYLGTVELKESDIRRIDITSSTSATHTLTWTAPNEQSLIVTINGVKQQNNYTVSGTTLTLDTALVATDELEVIGINDIGTTITPAQGSVDTDQLANVAVTTAKIADDAVTSAKIADGTIATANIADDAVTADKLADSINTEIAANTAKVTNATHTGDVTGATALTIAADAVDIAMLSATGTASSSTFLRGDNAWAAASSVMTPTFWAIRSGIQTISADAWVKIECDTEEFDEGGDYDHTTNYRFTPQTAGKYYFYGSFTADISYTTVSRYLIAFYKNGSIVNYTRSSWIGNGDYANEVSPKTSAIIDMDGSSDYVELYGREEGVAYGYYTTGTQFGAFRVLT